MDSELLNKVYELIDSIKELDEYKALIIINKLIKTI